MLSICWAGGRIVPKIFMERVFFKSTYLERYRAYFFLVVIHVLIDVSAINVKSSMCSESTKHFWQKCHGLFVNSPVVITAKSCLKCRSIH